MKKYKEIAMMLLLGSVPALGLASDLDVNDGQWQITFNDGAKTLSISQNGSQIVAGAYLTAQDLAGNTYQSSTYPNVKLSTTSVSDGFGNGKKYTYSYTGNAGKNDLEQSFYVYPNLPYLLVEGSVISPSGVISIIEICPIVSRSTTTLPLSQTENRIYNMPFSNDAWSTFATIIWSTGQPITSCEGTAFFNVADRKGIVIGSVDHSTWKSAITTTPNSTNRIRTLELKAGYISNRTWDIVAGEASSTHHGPVKGTKVDSPKFMMGIFDDWRDGLETYGDANTVLCPKYEWDKDESIFGWQSWGAMEFGINFTSIMSVLDFYEKELLPVGFHNEKGRCYMVLDSGWDSLTDDQLRRFANRCKELGIAAGIYTTPFSYWGSLDDARKNLPWEGGYLGEMVLKTNGEYRKITGVSLDPTHPAVKEWNRKRFEKVRQLGYEYIKIDFMNNGSQEADSYYLPEITTGMQAYNYGMDYIKEFAGDMMIDYSIAPIFPAKAHIRRIGCDSWGELQFSMYTLNCFTGSWWLDHVYAFNDPDNIVIAKVPFTGKGSNDEQEARIRYTSGAMGGSILLGNTFAYEGEIKTVNGRTQEIKGYDAERERAVRLASNKGIAQMNRLGRSFRPIEGTYQHVTSLWSANDVSTDNEFVLDAGDSFYYVVYNFSSSSVLNKKPDFARIGINPDEYEKVTELWFGDETTPANLTIKVPLKDVRVYRFDKYGSNGIESIVDDNLKKEVVISSQNGSIDIKAGDRIETVSVYDITGRKLSLVNVDGISNAVNVPLNISGNPIAVVKVILSSGYVSTNKVVIR